MSFSAGTQRGSSSSVQTAPVSRAARAFFGQSFRPFHGVRMRPMK